MNLLQNRIKEVNTETLTISSFREQQYALLDEFMTLIISYVSKQNNNYLQLHSKTCNPRITYQGIYNTELLQVETHVNSTNIKDQTVSTKLFFKLLVPKLINGTFFMINGNYYIPTLYILDKPIVIKKKSIKLYSLFNSLSISLSHDIATFTRANIPLMYLFSTFLETPDEIQLYKDIADKYKIKYNPKTEAEILNYFGHNINRNTREDIIKYFEDLFFDDYTKYLYKNCYKDLFTEETLTLKNVLIQSMTMLLQNKIPEYIDLHHKRLVFMELLLSPLFKRIGNLAQQAARGFYPDYMKIDQLQILKHFLSSHDKSKKGSEGMSGNYLYDTVNLMSGMLSHKVSMVNPGSTNPPSSISNTHPSHLRRVCPISVSNQKPGEVVSVLPTAQFDNCGQFI